MLDALGSSQGQAAQPTLPWLCCKSILAPRESLGQQVVDFQWHATDPYTMASVSDSGEGSTLQLWRISDMIWRPIDVVLAELEQHRWPLTLQPWLPAMLCAYCVCTASTMGQHSGPVLQLLSTVEDANTARIMELAWGRAGTSS